MTKKIKVNISRRAIYSSLVIVLFLVTAITVYSFNLGPPSEIGHSLDELDLSGEISTLIVKNLTVDGLATFNGDIDLEGISGKDYIHTDELISSGYSYSGAKYIKTHEFCLGIDYASADCIQDWDNLSGEVINPNAITWNYNIINGFPIEARRYYIYPEEYEYKIIMKNENDACWGCGVVKEEGSVNWLCELTSCI